MYFEVKGPWQGRSFTVPGILVLLNLGHSALCSTDQSEGPNFLGALVALVNCFTVLSLDLLLSILDFGHLTAVALFCLLLCPAQWGSALVFAGGRKHLLPQATI